VFPYGPVEDCAPFGLALERTDLIDTHEVAVAFDIRCELRRGVGLPAPSGRENCNVSMLVLAI
jgi:hypothetical protein